MTETKLSLEGINAIKSYQNITTKIAAEMGKATATIDRWLNRKNPQYYKITHPDFIEIVHRLTCNELDLNDYISKK
jgi:IS30 family transposase